MSEPVVMISHEMLAPVQRALEAQGFRAARRWDMSAEEREVTHAKGLNADDVADHAVGLILASWRDIALGDRVLREGGWRSDNRLRPRPGLKGRKLGIVGLGA